MAAEKKDVRWAFKSVYFIKKCWALVLCLACLGCGAAEPSSDEPNNDALPVTKISANTKLSAVWANTGEDKVTQEELRANGNPQNVLNSVWDGQKIQIFGAKNEVVAFNLILESAKLDVPDIKVSLAELTGPEGFKITSQPVSGDGVYNWVGRNIELFYVRYLPIKGLSKFSYEWYDERHLPERMQRPYTGEGAGQGLWQDRPDHDKFYPDIAVPLEWNNLFSIGKGKNQSIWVDLYIPKETPAGIYWGNILIYEGGLLTYEIPVQLKVYNFTLPDVPNSKTMLHLGYGDVNQRYVGEPFPSDSSKVFDLKLVRDRHFLLAHRHKISLIDANFGEEPWNIDAPRPDWLPRLNGNLFTKAHGYDGPGLGVGNNVFSIGTYSTWSWQNEGQAGMWLHTNNWVNWFKANAPETEYFLYLIDESSNFAQIEQWAGWIKSNPGPGKLMPSFATIWAPDAKQNTPSLDIPASTITVGIPAEWEPTLTYYKNHPTKKIFLYNGKRPASGSLCIEDDGIALRELAWGQYKKQINRWFIWESTYYNNFQAGAGQTNVFKQAKTFGTTSSVDPIAGETGWNYTNGDGVFFYPGTDKVFPEESYEVLGPIASLRLKHWRRGIQDVDYLTMAAAIDPAKVAALVEAMIPQVLWEYGVNDSTDPTWVLTDLSWNNDPQVWEAARRELAEMIQSN